VISVAWASGWLIQKQLCSIEEFLQHLPARTGSLMATPTAPAHADVPANVICKDDIGPMTGPFSSNDLDVSMAVVQQLRARSTGTVEAIQPLNELRNNALHDHPEQTTEILREYDRVLGKILSARYDAFAAAIRGTAVPFAEIDSTGRVVYARHFAQESA
jgi:hypothetical protein